MKRIDLSRLDLNLLVVFEALMAERHVGRSAARLHLTQSAASHALGRLRVLLDDQLFVRHPKGVEPTQHALALAGPITKALEDIRAIVAPAGLFDPARLKRTFRIGATDLALVTAIPSLGRRVRAVAPDVDIRVLPTGRDTVVASFDKGEIDFALGSYPELPRRLGAELLFTDHYVGVARAGHPALAAGFRDVGDLASVEFAMVSLRGDGRGTFDDILHEHGLSRRVAMTVPHFLALPFVVAECDLVALLPSKAVTRMSNLAGLATFDLPVGMPGLEMHLVFAADHAVDPGILWMRGLINQAALG